MSNFDEKVLKRYFSEEAIAKIKKCKIGIAGAGGLGSNCAQILTRCGFDDFIIADFDKLDYSNLNRQYYFFEQVGQYKVDALKDNLYIINQDVKIQTVKNRVTMDNVVTLFADCDIVIEAFDCPECKKMLVEQYINSDKLLISVSGIAGCGNSDRIKVHHLKDLFYVIGDLTTGISADNPPLAPCVQIAAAKQADIVLEYAMKK